MSSNQVPQMCVIGIGNTYRRDDGVGLEVARRLKIRLPESVKVIEHPGEGTALMALWEGANCVILIDAMHAGAAPGTVQRIDFKNIDLLQNTFRTSSHAFGLAEALALATELKRLPNCLILFGIEGADFSEGTGFSDAVAQAINSAANAVAEVVYEMMPKQAK